MCSDKNSYQRKLPAPFGIIYVIRDMVLKQAELLVDELSG
jgi:hypothetical protein